MGSGDSSLYYRASTTSFTSERSWASTPARTPLQPSHSLVQGIIFDFQPTGQVYVFDYIYLINTLVSAIVLLGLAGTFTDLVAFSCLPNGHSEVLEAHHRRKVNKKQGFAELGIRMANAAQMFAGAFGARAAGRPALTRPVAFQPPAATLATLTLPRFPCLVTSVPRLSSLPRNPLHQSINQSINQRHWPLPIVLTARHCTSSLTSSPSPSTCAPWTSVTYP